MRRPNLSFPWGSAPELPLRLLSVAVLVGVVGGLAGVGYDHLFEFLATLLHGDHERLVDSLVALPWYAKLLIPAAGGALIAPIVWSWVPEARGTGTPETMRAVAVNQGRIKGRVAVAKTIASSITISTGGSVGREGPIIQIGAALGSKFGQWLRMSNEQIVSLVGCGAAAGIAAVFNAPIAASFFALEVILGNFAAHSFAPIVLSSVTATAVSRAFLGNEPAFVVPAYSLHSAAEIPLYGVLGVLAGILGAIFTISLYKGGYDGFDRLKVHNLAKPVIGGLIVGCCLLITPRIWGTGFETISDMLVMDVTWTLLLVLVPLKLFATCVTVGSGGSGGIFSPSLFLGAALGGLFGIAANQLFPGIAANPGAYALVGMGAVLAGATHAPITSILMLFEITGDYQIILPLMIACTLATTLAGAIERDSIYTMKLTRWGISPRMRREEAIMERFTVRDVMRSGGRAIDPAMPLNELITEFMASRVNDRYVVSAEGKYLGYVSLYDIKDIMHEEGLSDLVVAGDAAHRDVPVATTTMTLSACMDLMLRYSVERLPVIDPATEIFLGTINEHDIISVYNREILKKDFLGTLRYEEEAEDQKDRRRFIHLPFGYVVETVAVPGHLQGRTLAEANLRHRYALTVVSIQDPETPERDEIPNPERPLKWGTYLVVIGTRESIDRFSKSTGEEPGAGPGTGIVAGA